MRTDRTVRRRLPGRRGRVAAVLAATLIGLVALATPAFAHSSLISSSPAADAMLPSPPTGVELVFNEDIRDFQPKLAITVGDHDPVEIIPTISGTKVTADLAGVDLPSAAGPDPVAWKIGYRVVSADGHPISGLIPFSVGDGPAPIPSPNGTESPAGTAPADGSAGDSGPPAGSGWGAWVWVSVLGALAVASAAMAAVLLLRRRRPGGSPGRR